ncbi:MAG: hypothetical protein NW215_08945 [Hyphomicrobiales bacterium]|nr:hypothetical protein [Hyphomicrobiales bacterium]
MSLPARNIIAGLVGAVIATVAMIWFIETGSIVDLLLVIAGLLNIAGAVWAGWQSQRQGLRESATQSSSEMESPPIIVDPHALRDEEPGARVLH